MQSDPEEIRKIVKDFTSAAARLRKIEPSFDWTKLLGDYGEYVAIRHYDLEKAPSNTKSYDATDRLKNKVQIKAVSVTDRGNQRTVKLPKNKNVDKLLVLEIHEDASWETIYYGPFEKVWKDRIKGKEQQGITVGRLRKLAANTNKPREVVEVEVSGRTVQRETVEEMRQYLIGRGFSVPPESTINARMRKHGQGWTWSRAFELKVPPKYEDFEGLVEQNKYEWYPSQPTQDSNQQPFISEFEKRIYVSKKKFGEVWGIPSWFISEQQKKSPKMKAGDIKNAYEVSQRKK